MTETGAWPGQAMCAVHPQTPAVGLCPRCGAYMCPWCQRFGHDGTILCASCVERVELPPVPWDQREGLGLWRAWWRTFKESLAAPDRFFARVTHSGQPSVPLLYATIAVWLGQAWMMLLYAIVGAVLAATKQLAAGLGVAIGAIVGFTVLAPVSALFQIYLSGGLTHLCARALGGRGSFQATARALGFAIGPYAFGVVPYLGGMAGWVTSVVLQVYGVKHAHGVGGGRAAAAVLIPLGALVLLCCGGYVALIVATIH